MFDRRLKRFFPDNSHVALLSELFARYKSAVRKYKACFATSHLRACLNQWCTSRRFGQRNSSCPFGCGDGKDEVEHCLVCAKFQHLFWGIFHCFDRKVTLFHILMLDHMHASIAVSDGDVLLLYGHVCYHAYNHCRHGATLSKRLLRHILRNISKHSAAMGMRIRRWMRHGVHFQ